MIMYIRIVVWVLPVIWHQQLSAWIIRSSLRQFAYTILTWNTFKPWGSVRLHISILENHTEVQQLTTVGIYWTKLPGRRPTLFCPSPMLIFGKLLQWYSPLSHDFTYAGHRTSMFSGVSHDVKMRHQVQPCAAKGYMMKKWEDLPWTKTHTSNLLELMAKLDVRNQTACQIPTGFPTKNHRQTVGHLEARNLTSLHSVPNRPKMRLERSEVQDSKNRDPTVASIDR